MKSLRTVTVLAALLAAAPLHAQRKINEHVTVMPDGHVRVQLQAGSVRVTAWDRDSVAIRGVVYETGGEKFDVQRDKAGVKISLWDVMAVKVPGSQLELFVPARSQLWVKTGSATISVDGVTGGVDVSSATGAIDVTGTPRELIAESLSGSVTADIRSRVARVRTATGQVTLRGAIADATAVTISGHVIVETSGIERGRFESVDGDVRYRADVARLASLEFVNHAGAIEVALPPSAAAEITVNSFQGTIESDLGVTPKRSMLKGQGTEETYMLRGGGAYLSLRTFKGPVLLRSLNLKVKSDPSQ
jgi:DUF4097 and DUF4098 domain-containing protein YvlB